jgi:hypothetical protein
VKTKPQRESPLKIDISFDEAISLALKIKPPTGGRATHERKLRENLRDGQMPQKAKKLPSDLSQLRPLTSVDTEFQTLGCRHSNPNICRNNETPGKCAFVRQDKMCLLPPRSWKAIFDKLKGSVV